jgi:exopolysaccharide production protein ExoY
LADPRFSAIDGLPIATEMETKSEQSTGPDRIRKTWSVVHILVAFTGDLVASNLALDFARQTRSSVSPLPNAVAGGGVSVTYGLLSIGTAAVWLCGVACMGGYTKARFRRLWEQATTAARSVLFLLASVGVITLLIRLQPSRAFVLLATISLPISWMSWRIILFALMSALARLGIDTERLLLVGPFDTNAEIRRHLMRTSATATRIVGEHDGGDGTTVVADILRQVDRHGVTSVVVTAGDALAPGVVRSLASALAPRGASVVLMPSSPEAVSPAVDLHPIGDLVLLRVVSGEKGAPYRWLRALIDALLAGLLLLVASPLLVVLAVLVRRTGRPIFFRQRRIGQGGRSFTMYKFRTMATDAEEMLKRDPELTARYVANGFKLPEGEDPRITPLGRTLRRTSLDELPQLFNVIRGNMSLVGPRPVVEAELAEYGNLVDAYTALKPGLTGYWQINGRSDVGFPERADLDAYYHDHRSVRLDLRILARTAITLASRRGAH